MIGSNLTHCLPNPKSYQTFDKRGLGIMLNIVLNRSLPYQYLLLEFKLSLDMIMFK